MTRASLCILAFAIMITYCSAQTCQSLIGSSCTGDQYNCTSQEVTCQSAWNSTCYSRSDVAFINGVEVRTWQKGCVSSFLAPYDCRGAVAAPQCTYTTFSGNQTGGCLRCCIGDRCNTGAPPTASASASASALAALSPIVLSLLSAFVVFLLK